VSVASSGASQTTPGAPQLETPVFKFKHAQVGFTPPTSRKGTLQVAWQTPCSQVGVLAKPLGLTQRFPMAPQLLIC
jgi:hypothetical protein